MSKEKTKEDVDRILELLTEHKKGLANLYQNYSKKFPEQSYWIMFSDSKKKSHETLGAINFTPKNSEISFDEAIFNSSAIKISLEWIWRLIEESTEHTLTNALNYSLDIEQSKIDQKYLSLFKTESDEISRILPEFSKESQEYILILTTEIKKL